MANNTDTYWEADGVSLHTYAWSIETIGGMGPPPLRGQDHTVPMKSGQLWVPKKFDSNVITLAMWLRGVEQGAGSGVVRETPQMYDERWNDLVRLLWTPGGQVALRKRFYDKGQLRVAIAQAEYAGGLQPAMNGRTFGRCTVDMKIAEGVFYDAVTQNIPLTNGDNVINVLGNAPTTLIYADINGARNNTKIRNKTLGVEFTYPRSVGVGESVHVDVDQYRVEDSTLNYDAAPHIIHSGDDQWLTLYPGIPNIINLSSASGAGTVNLLHKAAWV